MLLKTTIITFLLSISNVFANSAKDLGGDISLSAVSYNDFFINKNVPITTSGILSINAISLDKKLAKNVRAHIFLKIIHWFQKNGVDNPENEYELKKIINEAYIEIKNIGGLPVALVIGKQKAAFGQTFKGLPLFNTDPLYFASIKEEVIGFTVSLEDIGFFDLVEISSFETKAGDLSIGSFDGASIRMTKNLTDKIKAQISYLHEGSASKNTEHRGSIGFIYRNGLWTYWTEGIVMEGSLLFPDSNYAITAGAKRDLGFGTIAVQVSYIQESLHQIGLGFCFPVNDILYISPEIRYTDYYDGRNDSLDIAIRITYKFKR